ncbi:DCC1-like thiol-disulfide oxidoreductase family protein [Euzebya tangerina]|uniref:DCC1-like thiol-disulfide oxidoreductase family protein n=1 Tax=Euzebya tangerina TaxID=591198 RepID=UPI000E32161C|nr:DCC1-like thiol-disulfide oxidoreductase family protein [Euzebya tangerina]
MTGAAPVGSGEIQARPLPQPSLIPTHMTIVFDAGCSFCRRCAGWLADQEAAIPTLLTASADPEIAARYGHLPEFGDELMVVADTGQIWAGPDAFIVVMWCLARYRSTAMRLTGPVGQAAARRFFHAVSANREWLSGIMPDSDCATEC